jgi:hypothetical protein
VRAVFVDANETLAAVTGKLLGAAKLPVSIAAIHSSLTICPACSATPRS